jgi:hypothetical protein
MPAKRIFKDVFYVFFMIMAVADNVVLISALPNIFPYFFVAKSFKC